MQFLSVDQFLERLDLTENDMSRLMYDLYMHLKKQEEREKEKFRKGEWKDDISNRLSDYSIHC